MNRGRMGFAVVSQLGPCGGHGGMGIEVKGWRRNDVS